MTGTVKAVAIGALILGLAACGNADPSTPGDPSGPTGIEVVEGSFDFRACRENEVGVWVEYPLRWKCVANDAHEQHEGDQ